MSMSVIRLPMTAAAAVLAVLCGCSSSETSTPPAAATTATLPAGLRPAASILDLMIDPIAPNADVLWNAVGSVSTPTGVKDIAPATDAEWAVVRQKALALMEAANLLIVEGRVVARPGQKLKDPPGENVLTPAESQAAIAADRPAFLTFATALQAAGGQLVAAIDKRDVDAFTAAGGTLNEVCEACHQRFWYPDALTPAGQ
jgi:hypothetical protein